MDLPFKARQSKERALVSCLAGDFNGDGIDDLLVGAPYSQKGGSNSAGATYVIYGRDEPTRANIDLTRSLR